MKQKLVLDHLPLVRSIARRVRRELGYHVDLGDLEGSGMDGLLQAAERYQNRPGVSFATFARHRIRGAMYDFVRDRRCERHLSAVADVDALPSPEPCAEELAVARDRDERIRTALGELPRLDLQVLRRVYLDGKRLVVAGAELGFSKSWVSRIHARAVRRLRELVL